MLLLGWLTTQFETLRRHRTMAAEWSRLSERDLRDIGLSRLEIELVAHSRAAPRELRS
jgi:uncharacterized protein YjiS (DUF1127 family)